MESTLVIGRSTLGIRLGAVVIGAVLVALAAQVAVPLPGTPVPMTLQPMAVLLVGGLLGARLGALSMILYLAMGAAGLPVFTPSPLLLPGIARLFGQTGGYLLAYPIAAYAAAIVPPLRSVERESGGEDTGRRWTRVALGVFVGLVLIHLGGLAQLAILTGNVSAAAQLGTWPFLLGDLLKLVILVPVLTRLTPTIRARL
ncbi:MAG: biotin transporter BioY [Chloroflexi bacterium]|nr:MAG: biotin transporter BioY [Chloroflexota bacterium]